MWEITKHYDLEGRPTRSYTLRAVELLFLSAHRPSSVFTSMDISHGSSRGYHNPSIWHLAPANSFHWHSPSSLWAKWSKNTETSVLCCPVCPQILWQSVWYQWRAIGLQAGLTRGKVGFLNQWWAKQMRKLDVHKEKYIICYRCNVLSLDVETRHHHFLQPQISLSQFSFDINLTFFSDWTSNNSVWFSYI